MEILSVRITDPKSSTFRLQMKANINKAGPLAAEVKFEGPLAVYWEQKKLVSMSLDNFSIRNEKAALECDTLVTILDENAFGEFSSYL